MDIVLRPGLKNEKLKLKKIKIDKKWQLICHFYILLALGQFAFM